MENKMSNSNQGNLPTKLVPGNLPVKTPIPGLPNPSDDHHHKRKLSAAEILAIVSGSLVLLLLLLSLVANVDRMSKRRTKRR